MDKPYHIFASYASEDEEYACGLESSLKYLGIKLWFAPLSLRIGGNLFDSINAGLMASEYGLVILSPDYISKSWTKYELDVLFRQYIENDKTLFPIWHGIDKEQLESWNPALTGIVALKSSEGLSLIAKRVADVVYQNCPLRGIAPSYENPQWRFLQGRGELLANNQDGGAFNLFEAAEFPDETFPLYIHNKPYTKAQIILEVAKVLYYQSYDELRLLEKQKVKLKSLCKEYGYDLDAPGFDPAIYC